MSHNTPHTKKLKHKEAIRQLDEPDPRYTGINPVPKAMNQNEPPDRYSLRADAVVVLAGGVGEDGMPAGWTPERLDRGLSLIEEGAAPNLVLSGGWGLNAPRPPRTEAEAMKEVTLASLSRPIDPERVYLETDSRDTVGNAWFTSRIARLKGWRNLILITSDFHVPRASWVFSRILPDIFHSWIPVDTGLHGTQLQQALSAEAVEFTLLREWIGNIPVNEEAFARFISEEHPGYAKHPAMTLESLNGRTARIREDLHTTQQPVSEVL